MRNTPPLPLKWQIRDLLLAQLYKPVKELQERELRSIIEKNVIILQELDMALHKKILQEHFHRSFAYNGQFYSIENDPGPPVRNKLHPSLEPTMRDFITHYGQALDHEQVLVKGFFDSMLAYSSVPGDWLQILPQSLHDPLRAGVICDNWDAQLHPEKIEAFMAKHRPRYDLIRQRMAINLIL